MEGETENQSLPSWWARQQSREESGERLQSRQERGGEGENVREKSGFEHPIKNVVSNSSL